KQVVDIRELPNYSELNTMTLMLFLLNDVTETALMNLLQEFKKHNFKFKTEYEHKTKKILVEVRKLKKPIDKMDIECQYQFGDVADMVYQIILNLHKATGWHTDKLEEINKFILEYAKQNEGK
ncbi:MAG: hypothetical protein PHO12_08625, partial [Bacteroidales bacterium]|nr:hypothetical protein [Bacteroidales bacterium]